MEPIAHVPVAAGVFDHPDDFMAAYFGWRSSAWKDGNAYPEVTLPERLRSLLGPRCSEALLGPLVDEMIDTFKRWYPATLTLTPGVLSMLEVLAPHYRMGVVSNFFLPGTVDEVLEQFHIRHRFAFAVNSADIGFKKPDPRIYVHALSLAGCSASDVCFVGDNLENDVRAPIRHGMYAVHFDRRHSAAATPRIASWDEFEPVFS